MGETEVILKVFLISIFPDVPFLYFTNLVEERDKDFRTVFPNLSSEHPWTVTMMSPVRDKKGEKQPAK